MTTAAVKLMNDFKALSPGDQLEVRNRVNRLTEQLRMNALERLEGSGAGMGLLDKLLEDRSRDRDRD